MDSKKINSFCFSPILVHSSNNETDQQFLDRWNKFDKLPEDIKDKMGSDETIEAISQIAKFFSLNLDQTASISRSIRSYYFGELKIEDFPFVVSKETGLDLTKSKDVSNTIINRIIQNKTGEEKAKNIEKIAIAQAIKKYPKVSSQNITSNPIVIKNFPNSVRPTIANWLSDYTFEAGLKKHNSVERSQYLFHGNNTKKLSNEERSRLSEILKSYDENHPLAINQSTFEIIFSKNEIVQNITEKTTPNIPTPKTNIQISSNLQSANINVRPNFSNSAQKQQSSINISSPKINIVPNKETANPIFGQNNSENRNKIFSFGKKPENNISFSSPQKLSFEGNKNPNANISPAPQTLKQQNNPPLQNSQNKNVINLKEIAS